MKATFVIEYVTARIFTLVRWAEAHGRVADLVAAAQVANPTNPVLQEIAPTLKAAPRPASGPDKGEPTVAALSTLGIYLTSSQWHYKAPVGLYVVKLSVLILAPGNNRRKYYTHETPTVAAAAAWIEQTLDMLAAAYHVPRRSL